MDPAAFEHVECQVKEMHVSAWVHLAGRVAPPSGLTLVSTPAPGSPAGPLPVAAPLGKLPSEVRGRGGRSGELRRGLRPYPRRASRGLGSAGSAGPGQGPSAQA